MVKQHIAIICVFHFHKNIRGYAIEITDSKTAIKVRSALFVSQANHLVSFIDRYVTSSPTPAAILPPPADKLSYPTTEYAAQCRCLYRMKLFCSREQVNIDVVINCPCLQFPFVTRLNKSDKFILLLFPENLAILIIININIKSFNTNIKFSKWTVEYKTLKSRIFELSHQNFRQIRDKQIEFIFKNFLSMVKYFNVITFTA